MCVNIIKMKMTQTSASSNKFTKMGAVLKLTVVEKQSLLDIFFFFSLKFRLLNLELTSVNGSCE